MRVRSRLLGASLLGFSIAIAIDAQTPSPLGPPTGMIVGQVVDAYSGRPIGGAIVSISGTPASASAPGPPVPSPDRVIATADGRFVFRDLPPGSYGITATKPGYTQGVHGRRRPNGPSRQIVLADGERVADAVVRVWKHGAISGVVVDEAGEPVVSLSVRAFRRAPTMGARYFTIAPGAVTDDRGAYRLGNLEPAEYVVAVVARHVSLPTSIAASLQSRDLSGGIVVPELSAVVFARPGLATTMQVGGDTVYALGAGSAIPPPPAGDRMSVYATTFYPAALSAAQAAVIVIGSGEERSAIDFQLRPVPAARVSGSISGLAGPTAMQLRLVSADVQEVALEAEALSTMADRQGNFTFPAVPSGNYSLRAGSRPRPPSKSGEADDTLWVDMPLSVGRDDIAGVTVVLHHGVRISGRFQFDGTTERPTSALMQEVPLLIEPASPGSGALIPTPPARVDGDGHFTSVGLIPGKYFVRIGGSPAGWRFKSALHEGRDVADVPLDLRGNANVVMTFSDRWTSVRGTVTSQRGDRDLDAIVLLFPAEPQQWSNYGMNGRRLKSAVATRAGEYALTSIPEGDYYLVAIPDKDAAGWQDPKILEALSRVATRISIGDGEAKTQDLRTQEVR